MPFSCNLQFLGFLTERELQFELDLLCQGIFFHIDEPTEAYGANYDMYSRLIIVISWFLSLFSDQSTDRQVNCACENACTDTCTGYICFFTWTNGQVARGCFDKTLWEQCMASGIPNLFVNCCSTDYCNANMTLPKEPGQGL